MLSALLALAALAIFGKGKQAFASPLDKTYVSVNGAIGSGYGHNTGIGSDVRLGVEVKRWLDLELSYGYMPFSFQKKEHDVVYFDPSGTGPLRETFTDYSRKVAVSTYLGAIKLKPEWLRSDRLQPYFIGGAGLMAVRTASYNAYVPSENYARTENKLVLKGGVGLTIPILKKEKDQLLLQAELSRVQGPVSYLNSVMGLVYRFQ